MHPEVILYRLCFLLVDYPCRTTIGYFLYQLEFIQSADKNDSISIEGHRHTPG
jgi:hypothetical protein